MIYDILTTETVQIWLQERAIFKGQNAQEFTAGNTVTFWTDSHGTESEPLASYVCDENNSVTIDLTDYIRAFPDAENLYFSGTGFESPIAIAFSIVGLIDPTTMLIPPHDGDSLQAYIVPPHRMLCRDDLGGNTITALFYSTEQELWQYKAVDDSEWQTVNRDAFNIYEDGAMFRRNGEEFRFVPQMMQVCERYALVQWQSVLGVDKKHVFRLTEQKIESADNYSLDMFDNTLNATKGREESLTLYLDKLDTYDLWYYSDILTSSKVELLYADGHDCGNVSVEVTTKNVTIPSGEKADGKIEFEIKIKKYDAVSL